MQHQWPTPSRLLIFLLCSSFSALAILNTTCYFPTGDEIQDPNDFYQACPSSFGGDNIRMCCKTDGSFNDVCVSNGLCSRPRNPKLGEEQGLLRSTCTDPSWTSPSCLNLCTTGIGELKNILISKSCLVWKRGFGWRPLMPRPLRHQGKPLRTIRASMPRRLLLLRSRKTHPQPYPECHGGYMLHARKRIHHRKQRQSVRRQCKRQINTYYCQLYITTTTSYAHANAQN